MPSVNRNPQGSTEATKAYSIIPSFTEASRIYSVILQRQSLGYIRHALNMYFRFPFFLSFLKFEILVNKGSPVAIKLSTPLTLRTSESRTRLSLELKANAEQITHAVDTYTNHRVIELSDQWDDLLLQDYARETLQTEAQGTFIPMGSSRRPGASGSQQLEGYNSLR
jgi:hypothetical protein